MTTVGRSGIAAGTRIGPYEVLGWIGAGAMGDVYRARDERLVYLHAKSTTQDLWLLDLASGKSRQITRLSNTAAMTTFDIAPDGTQIVFDRVRDNPDLRLIDLPK